MRLPTERPLGACCISLKGLHRQEGLAQQREFSRWMNEPGQKPKATGSTRVTEHGYLQLRVMNPSGPHREDIGLSLGLAMTAKPFPLHE